MPARVQRTRKAGWRKGDAVIVDRTSRYGNPFVITDGRIVNHPDGDRYWSCGSSELARQCASDLYAQWLDGAGPDTYRVSHRSAYSRQRVLAAIAAGVLTGRDLACTCPLPEPGEPDHCHARVLMRRAAKRPLSPFAASEQPTATPKESR